MGLQKSMKTIGVINMDKQAREARREYMRKYRAKNRERIREYQRQWAKDNPDKVKQHQANYWSNKAEQEHDPAGDNVYQITK